MKGKLKNNLMKERQSLIQQRNIFNMWYALVSLMGALALLKLNLQNKQLELQERKTLTVEDQLTVKGTELARVHQQLKQRVFK